MEAEAHMEEGQSHSAVTKGVKTATFYGWKYKHYFVVVEEGENNLRARCTLCPPSKKPLSSARNTTSNFKKHLDTVHKTTALVEIARDTEGDSCTSKRKRNDKDVEIVAPQAKKQCMLVSKSAISLAKARSLVSEYVIEDMLPLSTVESPAFRKLVSGISLAQVSLPDRKSFTAHLDKAFDMMDQRVRSTLDGINFVCTTADVWTAHNKSFFGI